MQILDGSREDGSDKDLTVTRAKFELKGNYDASKKKKTLKKKEKLAQKKQKEKLLGWGGMGNTTGDTEIGKYRLVSSFVSTFRTQLFTKVDLFGFFFHSHQKMPSTFSYNRQKSRQDISYIVVGMIMSAF